MKNKLPFLLLIAFTALIPIFVRADIPCAGADCYLNPYAFAFGTRLGLALATTLILELLVAAMVLCLAKIPMKRVLLFVAIANIISVPVIWLIPRFFLIIGSNIYITIAEVFVIIFEALFIFLFNKKILSLTKSFILSVAMNGASLVFGLYLLDKIVTEFYFLFLF